MSMYLIKKLDVLSVAKVMAILGLIFGLIEGIIFAVLIGSMGTLATMVFPMAGLGAGIVLIMFIVLGAVFGFIGGAIWAFVYNVAAGFVGPIQADLEVKP
jgi:hypothetical protein